MLIHSQKSPKISHFLGIDFGKSKIGLALADNETKIAFAYTALQNDKNFTENLTKIIEEKGVEKIIIGIPSHINHKDIEYEAEKLGEMIKKAMPGINIEFQDEMFTTKMAESNLIEKGIKKIKRLDDQEAARIILQSWLDS